MDQDPYQATHPKLPPAGRRKTQPQARLNIGFILVPNFTLLPFAGFVDAIRLAADEGDRSRQINCRWTVMGETTDQVAASCGVRIAPWERFRDPAEFDYVVVVGGLLRRGDGIPPRLAEYLRLAARRRRVLIGLGTGTFVLARAGVMAGYQSCVSWYHLDDFREEFPDIPAVADRIYLVDRDRITCAGGTGVIDLAGHLIERHCSREVAFKSLRMILAEAPRPPDNPQPERALDHQVRDLRVRRAILMMEQNLTAPPSVLALAQAVNLGPRQLGRAFRAETGMSVMAFARSLRLKHAQWLLTHSGRPITEIAQECGFSDSAHLGRLCRRHLGHTPSSLRRAGPAAPSPEKGA